MKQYPKNVPYIMSISRQKYSIVPGGQTQQFGVYRSALVRRTPHRTVACAPRLCWYNAAGGQNLAMVAVRLIGVLALVALNGFFAATEFSLVAVRLSRVRQLVAKGNARARVVEALLGDLHRVVSGVQLGITLTSLALGALGEATFAKMIQAIWPRSLGAHTALFAHAIALACAFPLLGALQFVMGKLFPKTLGLARAERVALLFALPFLCFLKTFH